MQGGIIQKSILVYTWLLLFLLCKFEYLVAQISAKKYFEIGEEHRKRKEYAFAIDAYSEAIKIDSKNYQYFLKKGLCELIIQRYEDAILSFKDAIKANPESVEAYAYLAKIYINRKDYNRAVYYYNKAYEKESNPQQKYQYKLAAIKYLAFLDKLPEVVREMKLAIALDSNNTELYYRQGQVYSKMGNWEDALECYTQALKKEQKNNKNPEAISRYQYAVGYAHYKLGNFDQFYEYQRKLDSSDAYYASRLKKIKAIAIQHTANYFVRLARSYMDADFYEDALNWVYKAIAKKENLVRSYKMAGYIYYKIGDLATSIDYYQKAVQEEFDTSRHLRSYQIILRLQLQHGDYVGLWTNALKILRREPTNIEALYYAAIAAYHLKCFPLAQFYVNEAIRNAKKTKNEFRAQIYFLQGLLAKEAGNKSLAKAALKKVSNSQLEVAARFELDLFKEDIELRIQKLSSSELSRLANSYLEAYAYLPAQYCIEKAITKGENPALSYRIAGKVYYKNGNMAAAKQYLAFATLYETEASKLAKIYETLARLSIYYNDQEALKYINLALKILPQNAELLYLKGQIEYRLGLFSAAIATLEQSISLLGESASHEKRSPIFFTLGMAAKRIGRVEQAKEAFRMARNGSLKLAASNEIKSFLTEKSK
ncbi:MAG: tetratricopeptide repeat protein [Bacteroidia bacterium]|nr:tetratricopeptide repeat protein [Bacteroidia bacterium]MDW8158861.1 tetratricopeptide repeat protein [Bacteroidia bacterium]